MHKKYDPAMEKLKPGTKVGIVGESEIKDIKANGEDSKFLNEGEDPQDAVYERQSRIAQEKKKHEEKE